MVSRAVLLLSGWLTLVSSDDNGCQSLFCFTLLSRRIKIDVNLVNSDTPLPIEDYIRQSGYPVEAHEITTQDGYILTYHRIPHGKSSSDSGVKRRPILVQHGLLGSSACWVLAPTSLGFSLADAGFDVWLGNARGNTYSRRHIKYDPDKNEKKFWDFSWHEMGYYDLPASIDYILNATGNDKLFYAGHSMGTTMFFVLGATRPEYMDKVEAMVAMAPVAFPWNIRSPLIEFFSKMHIVVNLMVNVVGIHEVLPYSHTLFWLDKNICSRANLQFICRDIMFYIGGFDDKELNRTSLPTVLQYIPAGASYKQLRHFRQISSQGTNFRQYDYGFIVNFWKYHSFSPPVYNLTNVKAPIYAYYANNDWLAVSQDVNYAVQHLPNVQRTTEVPDENFTHLDFMWAMDAKRLLYDDMIDTLKKHCTYKEDE